MKKLVIVALSIISVIEAVIIFKLKQGNDFLREVAVSQSENWQLAARGILQGLTADSNSIQPKDLEKLKPFVPVSTKYKIEFVDYSPHIVVIHVTRRLSTGIRNFPGPYALNFRDPSRINELDYQIAEKLFSLNGVSSVVIDNYEVRVKKGQQFDWKELLTSITDILELKNLQPAGSM